MCAGLALSEAAARQGDIALAALAPPQGRDGRWKAFSAATIGPPARSRTADETFDR